MVEEALDNFLLETATELNLSEEKFQELSESHMSSRRFHSLRPHLPTPKKTSNKTHTEISTLF